MRTFNNIAKLVREKRLASPQGLSQNDLSKLLGYKNGQFISNVERGLCGVPFKNLTKLCEILSIEQSELKAVILKDVEETVDNYLVEGQAAAEGISVGDSAEAVSRSAPGYQFSKTS